MRVTGACVICVLEELELADDCDSLESEGVVEAKVTNDGVDTKALTDVGASVLKELEESDRGRITAVEVVASEVKVDRTARELRLDEDTCSVDDVGRIENAELSEVEVMMNEDVVSVYAFAVSAGPEEEF